jgi:hypothetical protein
VREVTEEHDEAVVEREANPQYGFNVPDRIIKHTPM